MVTPWTVLVAEDDPEMRHLIALALRKDGFAVREAGNGTEVLRVLRQSELDPALVPEVLVTDQRMPGATGLDLMREVLRRRLRTQVVLITAFGDVATHDDAYRLGAAWIFDKPFDIDDLVTAVKNLKGASTPD
jgi:DNA-binding NtrC family response regulator